MKAHIYILLILFLFAGCKNNQPKISDENGAYYTCSMHPQVMLHAPGKCPICGMGLILVNKSKTMGSDEIQLTNEQMQLANISVDTIHDGMLGNELTLTGTLNFDQSKITAISSRVMGRIEKLYFKNQGDYVKKGDKLYDLYSEDLNNAKREYILAIQKRASLDTSIIDYEQLIRSAKSKLLLWGLTESEIKDLTTTKETSLNTSFFSTVDGYITTLDVKEGDYIMEGGMIAHVADLSMLWVEAQVYNSEMSKIESNAVAEVQVGQKIFESKIEFVNSEVSSDSRINLIRVSIPNSDSKLRPGMSAYVIIKNPKHQMLSLPIDAVLRDGKGASVWVQTKYCTFKNKMVNVGMETGDRIEITSGLMDGDVVVISGAYLLNSEFIFKIGSNPMSGMKM